MKINNIIVQAPIKSNFTINPVEYATKARTASGKMVKDIIAIKRDFALNYNGLNYADYYTFLNIFTVGESVPFEYEDNNVNVTTEVYITAMPRGIYQELSNISFGISITLEEV